MDSLGGKMIQHKHEAISTGCFYSSLCIVCGDKFDKYSGDIGRRTCLTCVLKEEDPETIKEA